MHNPFPLHSQRLLDALIKAGHKYYVQQTYKRGINPFDAQQKGAFLITHYNNLDRALEHFEALKNDGDRFLYDVTNAEHFEKLKAVVQQPAGYKTCTPLLQQPWKPTVGLGQKIKRYIDSELRWIPGRNDTVHANLFIEFGELFITLKYRIHEVKVPLVDIEKTSYVL
jgi:hypothetical protein